MDLEAAWTAIAGQRRVLADLLDGLDGDGWERPSLCAAWRIRDVAAHVALTPRSPGAVTILARGLRARGDFDALNRDLAVEHAARIPDLVAALRADAGNRRRPAITTPANLVFDTIVHVQDVAVPLGLRVEPPVEAAVAGAERVWRMGWPFHARRRLRGLHLRATDAEWSAGEGAEIRGPVRALLLLLTGRTDAALPELTGPGVSRPGSGGAVR